MSYTPNNVPVYLSAYNAIAGFYDAQFSAPQDYAELADAWAQALDTAWGAAAYTGLELELIASCSVVQWQGQPIPEDGQRYHPTAYLPAAIEVISSGTAPTIVDVSGTMGSTGTYSLDPGSNDMAGIIILNPGGSGIGTYTIFHLVFSTVLPGNTPSVQMTLEDSGGNWGGGLTSGLATVHLSAVTNSLVAVFAINANGAGAGGTFQGVALPAGADQLRIAYRVTLK